MNFRQANRANFSGLVRDADDIKYIVVHYTAGKGDTAKNNADSFATHVTKTSAHYFVDENEVWQSVKDCHPAWHCGGDKYQNGSPCPVYGKCFNSNSIGIEMCSDYQAGNYYISKATQERAAKLVAEKMKEYGIPLDRVVRHYDVTGKHCPAPMVYEYEWQKFKSLVRAAYAGQTKKKEVDKVTVYNKVNEIPAGELRETVENLVNMGIIKGSETGLNLTHDMVRITVFMERRVKKLEARLQKLETA